MPYSTSPNCFETLRSSPVLVIVVVFIAMMLDVILMTSIDPILPSMLAKLKFVESNLTNSSSNVNSTGLNSSSSDNPLHLSLAMQIGTLVAAKPLLEMLSNILVGLFVDRFGHKYPMLFGIIFNFAATVGFGYAPSFIWLLVTRLAQAVGSSLSVVAGLALLAETFPNDAERCDATGKAFGGISLGIIIGYPFGSVVYQFAGPRTPFLILAGATLADGALRLLVIAPRKRGKILQNGGPVQSASGGTLASLGKLLCDPYILIGLGFCFMQHLGLGVFLATGPAWMLHDLQAEQWTVGLVLAIAVVFHFLAQFITGRIAIKIGRWFFCWVGMMLFSLGLALYPLCGNIWEVLGPEITVRLGHGMVLCVVSPLLAHVADVRHTSRYGLVYGLYTAAYNLGLGVGPIIGGRLAEILSFKKIYWIIASAIFVYSFLGLLYRRSDQWIVRKVKINGYGTMEDDKTVIHKEEHQEVKTSQKEDPPKTSPVIDYDTIDNASETSRLLSTSSPPVSA